MDYQLLLLIAMIGAVLLVGIRSQQWWRRERFPGYEYQRVISAAAGGLFLTIAGAIGWDLKYSHGWFQGTRWIGGPVWWELGVGGTLLLLAVLWARRVPQVPRRS